MHYSGQRQQKTWAVERDSMTVGSQVEDLVNDAWLHRIFLHKEQVTYFSYYRSLDDLLDDHNPDDLLDGAHNLDGMKDDHNPDEKQDKHAALATANEAPSHADSDSVTAAECPLLAP